ncbi:MAG: hypothetical protein ACE5HO_21545 [bacterium]
MVSSEHSLFSVRAVSGKVVRLPLRQWAHIVESHDYMIGNVELVRQTLESPDYIVSGFEGAKIALKSFSKTSISKKTCVTVFRENKDGFVITAFLTSKPSKILNRGVVLWEK